MVEPTVIISGVKGTQHLRGGSTYSDAREQYATSSYKAEEEDRMNPWLIVEARDKNDIKLVLQYAKESHIAVAIRTGGHQYSGASSTSGANIQLDLRNTFRDEDDKPQKPQVLADKKSSVRTSVSWSLQEFNEFLGKFRVFVPHGQCAHVGVGGHVQTGGYGQLARSFGLLGDHVRSLEVVTSEGSFIVVTRASHPDLFYALLGGSPGNLGVITHFTIEVHRDEDYKGSQGRTVIYKYDPETLTYLLKILVKMSDDESFPANYDLCISVFSSSLKLSDLIPEVDNAVINKLWPKKEGQNISNWLPFPVIVLYAQWVPFDGEVLDKHWLDQFSHFYFEHTWHWIEDMSKLTTRWMFWGKREFDWPYIKCSHVTNSKTLGNDGWVKWLVESIEHDIIKKDGCKVSAQIQCFGGKNSKFVKNAVDNGTSYSWRDSTLGYTLDCFYDPLNKKSKEAAEKWHNKLNGEDQIGPKGKFCKQDRRLLCFSYGDYNLDACWRNYYDDQAKYDKLCKARELADPTGAFAPNTFCVNYRSPYSLNPFNPNRDNTVNSPSPSSQNPFNPNRDNNVNSPSPSSQNPFNPNRDNNA